MTTPVAICAKPPSAYSLQSRTKRWCWDSAYPFSAVRIACQDSCEMNFKETWFNPRPDGVGQKRSPLHFSSHSYKTKEDIATKLCIPLSSSISHTLTEGIFKVGSEWRQSDVMFSRFRSKIRVRRNRRHEYSFKERIDWFSTKHVDWTWLSNCDVRFWNFWNFEIKKMLSKLLQDFFFLNS